MSMGQDQIDNLLERYLHLLHEYTSLREELTALQTSMYQNIARANFAAERGVWFGQDYYDDRMQASRLVAISCEKPAEGEDPSTEEKTAVLSGSIPSFAVINPVSAPAVESSAADNQRPESEQQEKEEDDDDTDTATEAPEKGVNTPKKPTDPLRWFGLLTPMALRQAQTQSVRAVEHVIPRLASVNAEMVAVEIEVRRARKRRAKAEAAASKLHQQNETKRGEALET